MFDALSLTEIDGQHVELLPARTVMSLFSGHGGGSCNQTNGDAGTGLVGVAALSNLNALNNISVVGNGLIPILSKGMC
jgi:hypothetical protein